MILLLALALSARAASPEPLPAWTVNPASATVEGRLGWGVALAERSVAGAGAVGDADLAAATLLQLVGTPRGERALDALVTLFTASPPRAAWIAGYERVLAQRPHAKGVGIALASARIRRGDPTDAASAGLAALLEDTDPVIRARARATWALARAHGWSGGAEAISDAVAAARTADIPLPADLELAALLLGRPELAGLSCPKGCPAALLDRGERTLALRSLGDAEDPLSLLMKARALRGAEVSAAWRKAVAANPEDGAVRVEAARVLLDRGDAGGARSLLGSSESALLREADAIAAVAGSSDPLVATEAALRVAPENPWIVLTRALALDRRATDGSSLPLWLTLLSRRPAERDWYGSLEGAAWAAHRPDALVPPLRRALAATESPTDWEFFASALANALGGAAGVPDLATRAGELARAAVALDPARPGPAAVAAGEAWRGGALEEAADLYAVAGAAHPEDAGIRSARVELLCQLHRWQEARDLLLAAGELPSGEAWRRTDLLEELAIATDGRTLSSADAETLVERARGTRDAGVLQQLGDALVANHRLDEALSAYEEAARIGGLGEWPTVGMANVYSLRDAEGDRERALVLIERLRASPDTRIQEQAEQLQSRLQVAMERKAGATDRQIFDGWVARLEADDSSAVWTRLGELYLAHWQYAQAEAAFRTALAREPVDRAAGQGLVRTLLAQGHFDEAANATAALNLASQPGAHGQPFAEEVRRRRQLAEITDDAANGRLAQAETSLAALRQDAPHDPELALLAGWLRLQAGHPADALAIAEKLLVDRPADESALGMALAAGWKLDDLTEVAPRFTEAAREPGAPQWVTEQAAILPTAARILDARRLGREGHRVEARRRLDEVPVPSDVRTLVLLGGAWLELGQPARAEPLLRSALEKDPGSVDAVRALAGSLSALGRPKAAERVLNEGWVRTGDPGLAAALVEARLTLAAPKAAAETLASLPSSPPPENAAPERLPDLPTATAENESVPTPPAGTLDAARPPAARVDVDTTSLTTRVRKLAAPAEHVAGTTIWRAGPAGQEQLLLYGAYAGHTDWLVDGVEWTVEAWPMLIGDGVESTPVVSGAAGLLGARGEPLRWEAWAGWSWPVPGPVLPTAHLRGSWRIQDFEATLSAYRTPATQTRFSLVGGKEDGAWYGRENDNWAQLTVGVADDQHGGIGALGRIGVLDGPSLEPLGWRQAVVWGSRPIRGGRLIVEPGVNAQVHGHDRSAELFVPGEAGLYTPILSAGAQGSLRVVYTPVDTVETCATGRAGVQWTKAQEWFLAPETYFVYTVGVGAAWAVTPDWRLTVLFDFDEAGQGWDSGGVQLALWHGAFGRGGPGPTATSSTHGIPLQATNACASVLR